MSTPSPTINNISDSDSGPVTFQQFCKDPTNPTLIANAIAQGVDIGVWQTGANAIAGGAIDVYQVASGDVKGAVTQLFLNCPTIVEFGQWMQCLWGFAEEFLFPQQWWNSILFQMFGLPYAKLAIINIIKYCPVPGKSAQLVEDAAEGTTSLVADANVVERGGDAAAAEIISMGGDNIAGPLAKLKVSVTMTGQAVTGAGSAEQALNGTWQTSSASKVNSENFAKVMDDAMANLKNSENALDTIEGVIGEAPPEVKASYAALKQSIIDGSAISTGSIAGKGFGEEITSLDELAQAGGDMTTWGAGLSRGVSSELSSALSGEGEANMSSSLLPTDPNAVISADSALVGGESSATAATIGATASVEGSEILGREAAVEMASTLIEAGETLIGGGPLGPVFLASQLIGMAVQAMGLCTVTTGLSAVQFNNYVSLFNEVFKTNLLSLYSVTTNDDGVQTVNPMYPIEVPASSYCFAVTPDQTTWNNYYAILQAYYLNSLFFDLSGLPICNINETYGSGAIMPTSGYPAPESPETRRQQTAMSVANSNTYYANFVLKWWPFLLVIVLILISIIIFFIIKNE